MKHPPFFFLGGGGKNVRYFGCSPLPVVVANEGLVSLESPILNMFSMVVFGSPKRW